MTISTRSRPRIRSLRQGGRYGKTQLGILLLEEPLFVLPVLKPQGNKPRRGEPRCHVYAILDLFDFPVASGEFGLMPAVILHSHGFDPSTMV